MGIAFLGYSLVGGQIRFWAVVVITSLLSVLPVFGQMMVTWVWGGFVVNIITLNFFFTLHFLLPFLLFLVVFIHLFFLHNRGRRSLLFVYSGTDKRSFFPYF
jgi:ubiquinol-cytochrome c reductase cytochrome b subunit